MNTSERFPPRIAPRDRYDWRLVLAFYAAALPLILAAALAWVLLPGMWLQAITGSWAIGMATMLGMDLAWIVYWTGKIVTRVEMTDTELVLHRALGRAVRIPWDQIESVEPVDRATVVRQGWLRMPPPLQTATLAASGHYRIRWKDGETFFPPRDAAAFEAAVRRRQAPVPPVVAPHQWFDSVRTRPEEEAPVVQARWWR